MWKVLFVCLTVLIFKQLYREAAHECKSVLDVVEKIFYHGILDVLVDNKLQEIVSHAVELLPKLWKQAGCNHESYLGKIEWDPSVVEHLTFALSLCSQTSILAKQLEKAMPGVFHPVDRWKVMACSYSGGGLNKVALNLTCLLLVAKICSEDTLLAVEGIG
ncbi:Protein NPG1 [Camellia lanceoleosa]|uniref:Protein NPG1 n=1 Tax=Camellia lanceoleosa TaxID=1840588 RepID=A0ACC0IES5_9ERIC|nr:Protein NPG1 [Camellia lanceoleosa]